jgi:hypothetical protein
MIPSMKGLCILFYVEKRGDDVVVAAKVGVRGSPAPDTQTSDTFSRT